MTSMQLIAVLATVGIKATEDFDGSVELEKAVPKQLMLESINTHSPNFSPLLECATIEALHVLFNAEDALVTVKMRPVADMHATDDAHPIDCCQCEESGRLTQSEGGSDPAHARSARN